MFFVYLSVVISCIMSTSYYFFVMMVFFFKQKTAYEMRISDWSSDVCSSDLVTPSSSAAADVMDTRFRWRRVSATASWNARYRRNRGNRRGWRIGRASCRERVCQYV